MIPVLVGAVSGLLDKFIEDKDQKNRLAHEISTMAEKQAQELALAQIEVNKAEAASGSTFAYHFVLQPLLVFLVALMGWSVPQLPEFDMASLMTVLGGLLGLGSLRTFEKFKGVSK